MIVFLGCLFFCPNSAAAQAASTPPAAVAQKPTPSASQPQRSGEIVIEVRSFPDAAHYTSLRIVSDKWTKAWTKVNQSSSIEAAPAPQFSDVTVTVQRGNLEKTYIADDEGHLYDPASGGRLKMPDSLAQKLSVCIRYARSRHYGKLVPWDEARYEIPNRAIVTVLDLRTGLTFRAQRRAGSSHADVQPLTSQDTKIMKQIYNGQWSWDRRAVLVRASREWIAASMHGMPHGGDGIPGNDFNGHFCIHFLGSTTHRSRNLDAAHQAMVYRAAGQLGGYLQSRNPWELAELYVVAVNQQDSALLDMLLTTAQGTVPHPFADEMDRLDMVKLVSRPVPTDITQALDAEVRLQVAVYYRDFRRPTKYTLQIACSRTAPDEPWQIRRISAQ